MRHSSNLPAVKGQGTRSRVTIVFVYGAASNPTVPLRSRLWANGIISREPQLSETRALLCTICGTVRELCYWDQTPPLVDPATKSRCP
jgi:hypothetical protein